jgi:hypothetical protein
MTGQQIINQALTSLNILDAGGAPSASESADLLIELNQQTDAWSADETLIPSVAVAQYLLAANVNPYALGPIAAGFTGAVLLGASATISAITDAAAAVLTTPAAPPTGALVYISGFTGNWAPANGCFAATNVSGTTFSIPVNSTGFGAIAGTPVWQLANVSRPVRVDGATIVSTVGSGTNRNPVQIVSQKTYFAHNDLSATASSPDEVYFDYADASGLMQVYLFPVATCPTATKIELITWNAIQAFALGTNQTLPPGYQDAIVQALAFRCLPRYGASVNQATAQIVTQLGVTAKDRVKRLNVMNRLLDPSLAPPTENQQREAAAQQQQQQGQR